MVKKRYKAWAPRQDSLDRVDICNSIISSYHAQGFRLTLRQLYYQLVSRNIIANTEKEYRALGTLVSNARLGGMIDWSAIEDRVRQPWSPNEFDDLRQLVHAAVHSYRLPRWRGQQHYAELWVEKDALAGVLQPLASEFHVTLMVNRGYSSQSAMYESAQRFLSACALRGDDCDACGGNGQCESCAGDGEIDEDEPCADCGESGECSECDGKGYFPDEGGDPRAPVLFYLGDLDPSGEDMVRDIRDRLEMFGVEGLKVEKLALNMTQVRQYNPPPNPAKMSDSRARSYVEKHGAQSWEVDALDPQILHRIIRNAFKKILDHDLMDAVKAQENEDKEALQYAVEEIINSR